MNLINDLSKKITDNIGTSMRDSDDSVETFRSLNNFVSKLEQNENLNPKKKTKKKNKGKLETKESTSAGSAGGFVQPLFSTTKRQIKEDIVKGGLSDNKTIQDIFKKHNKKYPKLTLDELKKQLQKGIKVEMEHTDNRKKAEEITKDHLFEDPKYYDKLQKMETKEATTSASSGSYETPKAWAKSTSKKDWRGRSKTQIPGGQFVTVKEKCKKFPYCNQGDINALNLTNEDVVKKTITELSQKYNISEDIIKKMIMVDYNNIK